MPKSKPPLRESKIIAWAKAHRRRHGRFPSHTAGKVEDAPGESWAAIDRALRYGSRGLSGRSSLARLLDNTFEQLRARSELTVTQIIDWAKSHHRRTGQWPDKRSGPVAEAPGETWVAIDGALRGGWRGLPAGASLSSVLAARVGRRPGRQLPRLSDTKILTWADHHHRETGRWPTSGSGKVRGAPAENWAAINGALRMGNRGLKPGRSLSMLLAKKRHVRRRTPADRRLTIRRILAWADHHHRTTGGWPTCESGKLIAAPEESWGAINRALSHGGRRLKPGLSLSKLLARERNVIQKARITTSLTVRQILSWADEHYRHFGEWPRPKSGRTRRPPFVSWGTIDQALRSGACDAPKGTSIQQLLRIHRGAPFRNVSTSKLSIRQIVEWAKQHHDATGKWPTSRSGSIVTASGETWITIESALKTGCRGFPGGDTLARFLERHVGRPMRKKRPSLSEDMILKWARQHHRTQGRWPSCDSGAIAGAASETWGIVDQALRGGFRGLKKGLSLARLLDTVRGNTNDHRRKRPLKVNDIILWVRAYYRRMGKWPDPYSGRILDARGETWFGVDQALCNGWRGLSGPKSLQGLVAKLKKPNPLKTGRRSAR